MRIKSNVWIENDAGEAVYGPGRHAILEAIRDGGSIKAAAEALGMSYRALWGRLKTSEKRLGFPLVHSTPGSGRHSGTTLTPAAEALMLAYGKLLTRTRANVTRLFEKDILPILEDDRE